MSTTFSILLRPISCGWAVCLSDGRELARFRGPGARFRALLYVHSLLPGGRLFRS